MVLAFIAGSSIQLVPDGTIIIHIALILLMIWVLNRTFFRPINRVLASRDKNKGGQSSEAAETMALVESKLADYTRATRDARAEGYKLIETERAAAVEEKNSRVEAAKADSAQRLESEKAALQAQTEVARQSLAAEAQQLAEKISSSVLRN